MKFITEKQERIRFLKFSFVGVTGTIVDFGVMNLLSLTFNMPLVGAQGISFATAVINNFLWNRYWTYPESKSKGAPKQMLQFGLINIIGLAIRTPLITWLNQRIIGFLDHSSVNLPVEITYSVKTWL
jgi:putative flippase GtrA